MASERVSVRWQFVEGYEGDSSQWSWRVVNIDGTMNGQSQPFKTYGLAVSDAIKNGFQPRMQHWVVATRHTMTHFRPGKQPITVPVVDKAPLNRVRGSGPAAGQSVPLDPPEDVDSTSSPQRRREKQ